MKSERMKRLKRLRAWETIIRIMDFTTTEKGSHLRREVT